MALTEAQLALVVNAVTRKCLIAAGDDTDAGIEAANVLMSIEPDEWFEERYRKIAAERDVMQRMLDTLNAALEKRRGVRLAIEDKLKKAHLYGMGNIGPLFPAVTEVGRLANIMTEPEVGSTSTGALDTAKVGGKRGKGMGAKAWIKARIKAQIKARIKGQQGTAQSLCTEAVATEGFDS
jgi:hypothetical protein